MRTTVEITEEQHRALSGVARRRGLRGFSQLVQEALDAYLRDLDSDEVDLLLSLDGSLDERDERELRTRIEEARAVWRASWSPTPTCFSTSCAGEAKALASFAACSSSADCA